MILALLAQQSINLNKVTCIRISQEQTVFKTTKNKDAAQILSI
jgi:hypothetical protein